MRFLSPAILLLGVFVAAAADAQPTITLRGPTIIAFFEPVSPADLKADPDLNESLSDFQFYASSVRNAFRNVGFDFHEIYVKSFRIRDGTRTTTFRPGKITVGYYFVAPSKKPRVEYGVMTETDLLAIAKQYFSK